MAFVYRAERSINQPNQQKNGTYPGEYFSQSTFIKDIDKQSSEFQSNSIRDFLDLNKSDQTPGPGSYENNIGINSKPAQHYHKNAQSKDIYDAVKKNLMSKEIINFIEKNKDIAFNTRAKRFNYVVDDLEKKKKLPGPGSYSPNGSSMNLNTDCSTILNQNNSSKRIFDYSKKFPTTHSNYRTETIPSKGNIGYEFDKDGIKKMINYSVISSDKNESLRGPGYYNISYKKKENGINWSKTRDDKNPKYNLLKFRKNLNPLTELEKDYLKNKEKIDNKSKTTTSLIKKNQKDEMFKYLINQRKNIVKKIRNKIESGKFFIFDTTPGPGYYESDDKIFSETQDINVQNNRNKCFQSTSPRFGQKTFSNINTKLGPGYYYQKNKPKDVKKDKLANGHLINVDKDYIDNSALKISMIKEDFKVPGPGYYEIIKKDFPKAIATNHNFGINDERFKVNADQLGTPGPGQYGGYIDQFTRTTIHSMPKNSFKNKKLFTNSKTDLINVNEVSKFTREKFFVPPIGLYNPNIITSIDYKNKSKINTFVDKTVVGFGTQEKKETCLISKENNKMVGPGIYYKSHDKTVKQNNAPFNQNEQRFDYNEKNRNPGPGSYELNSFEEWNKKSHNILFV